MWGLLASTILTSAADSLNPIAISQQFVLQGMVKKPRHIWYFIIPTGVVNLMGGFLAYFGLVALMGSFLGGLVEKYGRILFTAELILGIVCFVTAGLLLQGNKIKALRQQLEALRSEQTGEGDNEREEAKGKIRSVSPLALVALGTGATISELSTALPYFAFLAILFNYQLTLAQVSLILVIYNFIYTSPLMILYFIYRKAQDRFDRLYVILMDKIKKWGSILAPTLAGILGAILIYHSIARLLTLVN